MRDRNLFCLIVALFASFAVAASAAAKIDRKAWVERHDPVLRTVDPHAPLMLGNGAIGFTADITGLQTFPQAYSALAPLLTEAQWAWHSFPNPNGYTAKDTLVPVDVRGTTQFYPYMKGWNAAATIPADNYIRENPHRFSLLRFGFVLRHKDGSPAKLSDIIAAEQRLDLWRGLLISRFRFDGEPVEVRTFVAAGQDAIVTEISSPLLADGRLALEAKFPGVSPAINPDPSDWDHPDKHITAVLTRRAGFVALERRLDSTRFYAAVGADASAQINPGGPHDFRITARKGATHLNAAVEFASRPITARLDTGVAAKTTERHWAQFWREGGAVDLSGSTDPRAPELERRIVLSLYLEAVNGAGEVPPQEEGLFSNSWNGKFHLEMHPWHSAHLALWGHTDLLEKSMAWYIAHLPDAEARAASHGVKGAWWPKMVGPDAVDSPSVVSPFLMWQQPHPIFLSELIWRAKPTKQTLARYGKLVDACADLLASWPHRDAASGRLQLGPPLIPVQENWDPMTTFDPAFELEYFRFGLETAQQWRLRAGLPRRADWDAALAALPPLTEADGLYLPTASKVDFWKQAASDMCRAHAVEPCMNRDHPSVLMAMGILPGQGVDPAAMARTFDATLAVWDLRQTWGWDYPMMAMTAARLHRPEQAIDMLFYPGKNNQWGLTGMTPRVHIAEHAASFVPGSPGIEATPVDGPGYRRAAETYFPSNGGLLWAVALMAAGWDGEHDVAPGFPKQGWKVRVDGIKALP